MIRITVELLPFGLEESKRHLGQMNIWNDVTGTKTLGNYGFKIFNANGKLIKRGTYKGFRRLSQSVWKLMYLCLSSLYDK